MALGLGGNAAGTGINAHPKYRERVVAHLAKLTGTPFRAAANLFEAMQSMAPFVRVSNDLRGFSLDLTRIANDLRLLASGPTTGFDEIVLPAVQPGSSIMPGKVNPVIAEMTNMVAYQVLGYDTTVAYAAQAGQLELNVMMPVIAHNLLRSLSLLTSTLRVLRTACIDGITANEEVCRRYFERRSRSRPPSIPSSGMRGPRRSPRNRPRPERRWCRSFGSRRSSPRSRSPKCSRPRR